MYEYSHMFIIYNLHAFSSWLCTLGGSRASGHSNKCLLFNATLALMSFIPDFSDRTGVINCLPLPPSLPPQTSMRARHYMDI